MLSESCSVCLENESKYTCPACEAKTCSLVCVKRHKLRTECTGTVDPTKFVSRRELSAKESLVNRDYNYLLNFERKISNGISDIKENARRILKRPNAAQNRQTKRQRMIEDHPDPRLASIQKYFPHVKETTIKRENTLVIHLPPGMARSNQNKTGYDRKTNTFTWTIEWVPLAHGSELLPSFLSYRIKETTALRDAVPLAVLAKSFAADLVEKDDLSFYLENCVKTTGLLRSLIELDPNGDISAALKDAIVLEYPRIHVFRGEKWPDIWQDRVVSKDIAYGLRSNHGDTDTDTDTDSDSDSELGSSSSESSSENSTSDEEGPEEFSSKPLNTPEIPEEDTGCHEEK